LTPLVVDDVSSSESKVLVAISKASA